MLPTAVAEIDAEAFITLSTRIVLAEFMVMIGGKPALPVMVLTVSPPVPADILTFAPFVRTVASDVVTDADP